MCTVIFIPGTVLVHLCGTLVWNFESVSGNVSLVFTSHSLLGTLGLNVFVFERIEVFSAKSLLRTQSFFDLEIPFSAGTFCFC